MYRTRVGVLRGGPSAEYEVSLKTGQSVLHALSSEEYELKDILIDREGVWHLRGIPIDAVRVLDQVDVVFNALHGTYGEDGGVQRFLDTHGARYTGSGALSSAIAMNKVVAKDHFKDAPFRNAHHRVLLQEETDNAILSEIFRTFMQPCVIKPVSGGSSVATALVRTLPELHKAVSEAFLHGDKVLVENYIRGREATVAVADGFRGEELYVFPPVEITYTNGEFFDYNEKYSESGAKEICPAPFEKEITTVLMNSARHVHRTLHLRDYSRSDFIVTKKGDIFFLEVNTLPGLTPTSLVPKSIEAVGASLSTFLSHLVERAKVR